MENVARDWTGVNSMEELKKCPFCGGEAMLKINYGFDEKVISSFVYCEECGVATRRCTLVLQRILFDAIICRIRKIKISHF